MNPLSPKRIMAVDPGVQHLGVAIFDGEELLRYGVKGFQANGEFAKVRSEVQQYLAKLLMQYSPSVLVVEEPFYAQALLSKNLCQITKDLKAWGKWKGLEVYSYYPPEVKAFFCRDQRTRESLAEAITERYPFLRKYFSFLPWQRRYWFHVFDAVGLGLMCAKKLNRGSTSPRTASFCA